MKNTIAHRFRHAAEAPSESEDVPVFSVEDEGSDLLKTMQRRLEELGWMDERGNVLFADMVAMEVKAFPKILQVHDWFDDVGEPEEHAWDDFKLQQRGER